MVADGKLIILLDDCIIRTAVVSPSSYKEIPSGNILEGEHGFEKFWTSPVFTNVYFHYLDKLLLPHS
jgi:hypothetical protein